VAAYYKKGLALLKQALLSYRLFVGSIHQPLSDRRMLQHRKDCCGNIKSHNLISGSLFQNGLSPTY